MSDKKCEDQGVVCSDYPSTTSDYCELSAVCPPPILNSAQVDKPTYKARDNMTVQCNDGFQFPNGKTRVVYHCQPDGKWNSTIEDCIPTKILDKDHYSCDNFTERQSVLLHSIRTTSVVIIGSGLNCNPDIGYLSVTSFATIEQTLVTHCVLLGGDMWTNSEKCTYQCKPGYNVVIHIQHSEICEIIID